jgi:hypothetical protein
MELLDAIDPARLVRRAIREIPPEVIVCVAAVLTLLGLIVLVQGSTMRAQARNCFQRPWWGQPVVLGQEVWDRRAMIFMAVGGSLFGAGLLVGGAAVSCMSIRDAAR